MSKLTTLVMASIFALGSASSMAADTPSDPPPAQKQANKVPESTSSGSYLEAQPDENGATGSATDKKSNKKGVKPTNIEKAKNHTENPESGGAKVESR